MTEECVATAAVGAILSALIMAQRYDTSRNLGALSAEIRAEIQGFRQDFRADIQNIRADIHSDSAHVGGDLAGLRSDIQARTVRMARIQDFLVGYFTARGVLDRHDNA